MINDVIHHGHYLHHIIPFVLSWLHKIG